MIRLRLNGKWYEHFNNIDITLSLNTVASTFKFSGFNKWFDILKYDDCEVYFDNERIISGTILNPAFKYQKKPTLLALSGYSKTGILEDSNYPISLYPTQFDGLNLMEITQKITNYFRLKLKVYENALKEVSIPFEKVSIDTNDTIKSFLSRLADQRGLILAHDNYGRLLLYKVEAKTKPQISLNISDALSVDFTPNAQGFHSEITVLKQSTLSNNNGEQTTVKSPWIYGINRPSTKTLSDGDQLEDWANKLMCSEARNFALKLTYEGHINVRSGFYITFEATQILTKPTKFIIETVQFLATKKSKTTTMNIVLPCVYTGILPSKSPFI